MALAATLAGCTYRGVCWSPRCTLVAFQVSIAAGAALNVLTAPKPVEYMICGVGPDGGCVPSPRDS